MNEIATKRPMTAMCIGAAMLAVVAAAPAYANPPEDARPPSPTAEQGSQERSTERVKRVGTRLETIIVTSGAVDPHNRRWDDSGAAIGVLPTVSASAFLDAGGAERVETPADSRP
jgi:hypothetical protein